MTGASIHQGGGSGRRARGRARGRAGARAVRRRAGGRGSGAGAPERPLGVRRTWCSCGACQGVFACTHKFYSWRFRGGGGTAPGATALTVPARARVPSVPGGARLELPARKNTLRSTGRWPYARGAEQRELPLLGPSISGRPAEPHAAAATGMKRGASGSPLRGRSQPASARGCCSPRGAGRA